jgi:endonuclease-3
MKSFKKLFLEFEKIVENLKPTLIEEIKKRHFNNHFTISLSTALSQRSKDSIVLPICIEFFHKIKNFEDFLKLDKEYLYKNFYRIGLAKIKIDRFIEFSKIIKNEFNSKIPNNHELVLSLPGIGRKSANLILSEIYRNNLICVDAHVFRLSKQWGISNKKSLFGVENDLMSKIPKKYWKNINYIFVKYGQNICKQSKYFCGNCTNKEFCIRIKGFFSKLK